MAIMNHAKFHFNWLMLTLIFGIRTSEPPPPPLAWRTTEKAGSDRVNWRGITAKSHIGSENSKRMEKAFLVCGCHIDLVFAYFQYLLSDRMS